MISPMEKKRLSLVGDNAQMQIATVLRYVLVSDFKVSAHTIVRSDFHLFLQVKEHRCENSISLRTFEIKPAASNTFTVV